MDTLLVELAEAEHTLKRIELARIEALVKVVLRLVDRRFGVVTETVRRRVEAIETTEPLYELAEHVLEAHSIDELGLTGDTTVPASAGRSSRGFGSARGKPAMSEAEEYERLLELPENREVKVMTMTYSEQMEAKGVRKGIGLGIEKGIESLRQVILRLLYQRFGQVPETVRRGVEALDSMKRLEDLAGRVWDMQSIEEMGLS